MNDQKQEPPTSEQAHTAVGASLRCNHVPCGFTLSLGDGLDLGSVCPSCGVGCLRIFRDPELVENALRLVESYHGDTRCALSCMYAEALAGEVLDLRQSLSLARTLRHYAQRYGDEMNAGRERAEAEVERVTKIHTDWLAMANGTQEAMVSFMNQDRAEIARLSVENARLTAELAGRPR